MQVSLYILFIFIEFAKEYIADVSLNAGVAGIPSISRTEWDSAVQSDDFLRCLASVFDDIRRKFSSNVKNEYNVRKTQLNIFVLD